MFLIQFEIINKNNNEVVRKQNTKLQWFMLLVKTAKYEAKHYNFPTKIKYSIKWWNK